MRPAPGLPSPRTTRIAAGLREWMYVHRLTQAQVAARASLSQATVSRALHGRLPVTSAALNTLCTLAGVDLHGAGSVGAPDVTGADPLPPALTRAVRRIWDGTQADADRIAGLLDAVAALRVHRPDAERSADGLAET